MKRLHLITFLSLLAGCIFLASCDGGDDGGLCTDPIITHPFPASANAYKWLFTPFKVGTNLKFRVYYRPDRNSNYVYRRAESFVVKDTMYKKMTLSNTFTFNCNEQMIIPYLIADFTGPEPLTMQLTDQAIFQVDLQGMAFNQAASLYGAHQPGWLDSLNIGGQEYYSVNLCRGVMPGSGYYTDSTYMFYNQEYGLVKFIINDTLTYIRNLH